MSLTEIIVWIVAVVTVLAFILSFTLLMMRAGSAERLLVEAGQRDTEILVAFKKLKQKKNRIGRIVSLSLELLLLAVFLFLVFVSIYSAAWGDEFPVFGSQVRLIGSNSMASDHDKTKQLVPEDKLTVKFSTDDLIVLSTLPAEEALAPYDIVTYVNAKGEVIVHRIVAIETDGAGVKLYTMRGDGNASNDSTKIKYSDMRAIYAKTVSGLGVIVRFTHSTFFIIAIIVCFYIGLLEEILTARMTRADKKRLAIIDPADPDPPTDPDNPDSTFPPTDPDGTFPPAANPDSVQPAEPQGEDAQHPDPAAEIAATTDPSSTQPTQPHTAPAAQQPAQLHTEPTAQQPAQLHFESTAPSQPAQLHFEPAAPSQPAQLHTEPAAPSQPAQLHSESTAQQPAQLHFESTAPAQPAQLHSESTAQQPARPHSEPAKAKRVQPSAAPAPTKKAGVFAGIRAFFLKGKSGSGNRAANARSAGPAVRPAISRPASTAPRKRQPKPAVKQRNQLGQDRQIPLGLGNLITPSSSSKI